MPKFPARLPIDCWFVDGKTGKTVGLLPSPLRLCAKIKAKVLIMHFHFDCSGVCLAGFLSNQYEGGGGMFNKDERTEVDAFPYDPSEIDDQEE